MLGRFLALLLLGVLLTPEGQSLTSAAVNKDLPEVKSKAFVAKLSGVILDKGETISTIEKYDATQNKASITLIKGDDAVSFILNYADQSVTTLNYTYSTSAPLDCIIVSMSTIESNPVFLKLKHYFHFFGGFLGPSGKGTAHLFPTQYIFNLNNSQPFTYQGTTKIEGIDADHWSSPVEWTQDKEKFTLHYYFTPSGWRSPESDDPNLVYPLRAEIIGTKTLSNGKTKNLHRIYDYIDFTTHDYLSPEEFDIPDGDVCRDDGSVSKPIPSLPDVMSYTREVVDSKGNVDLVRVTYNHKRGTMFFAGFEDWIIYDFNDGVKYKIGENSDCHQSAINPDVDDNAKTKGGYVTDLGPLEFWLLKNSFTYAGERRTRYIDSSSWVGSINSLPFDVHFAKTGWTFRDQALNQTALPPLQMTREGKHYNFFAFRSASNTRFHSLLRLCRSKTERKAAIVVFHEDRYYYGLTKEEVLTENNTYTLSLALAKGANVHPNLIAISFRNTYVKDRHLYLYFRIIGAPSPRYLYRRQNKTEIQRGSSLKFKTSTVSGSTYDDVIGKSAALCEATTSSGSFNCRNFDLCKKSDGSYDMRMYGTVPSNVKTVQSTSCDRFARSVDTKPDIPLSKAWSNLQDNVNRGLVKLGLQSSTYRVYSLTAIEAKMQPRSLETDIEDPGFKFNYFRGPGSIEKTETVNGAENAAVCAQQCLSRTEFECKAFEYCTGTQQCILSQSNPTPVKGGPGSSCFIMTRNYISDFIAMQGVTLAAKGSGSQYLFTNVSNPNDCAKKCMKDTSTLCESFTYCKTSKQCSLSTAHIYGVDTSRIVNTSSSCTHYSKNYIFDFKVTKKTTVVASAGYGVQAISVSSAKKCAYLCRTGYDGQGCVQFDFCQDSSLCQIVSNAATTKVGYKGSSTCDVYKLNAALRERLAARASPSTSTTTFSNGSFAGLGVGMVIIGLAIGALLVFVLHRTRHLHKIVS